MNCRRGRRDARLGPTNKGTVGRLLCRSAVARQLASLEQGERATAGSDEGTHSPEPLFDNEILFPRRTDRGFFGRLTPSDPELDPVPRRLRRPTIG